MLFQGDSDWTKVPVSGRIEVKIKENRFSLKDAIAQITSRTMTSDASQLVKRESRRVSSMPISPAETPFSTLQTPASRFNFSPASELPALHTTTPKAEDTLLTHHSPSYDVDTTNGSLTMVSGSSGEPLEKL